LVGVGIMLFLKPVALTWLIVILGASLASIVQQFFLKRKIPVFTLPFVLVTWLAVGLANHYAPYILVPPLSAIAPAVDYLSFGFKGYGQVIFQESLAAGM